MSQILTAVRPRVKTQMNESLNALKAADKNTGFPASWDARCAIAVLRMNRGPRWISPLRESLVGEPLAAVSDAWLSREGGEREQRLDERRTDPVKIERYASRSATAERKKNQAVQAPQREDHEESVSSCLEGRRLGRRRRRGGRWSS
jgi:hypothetical protein